MDSAADHDDVVRLRRVGHGSALNGVSNERESPPPLQRLMLSPLKGRGLWPVPVLPGGPVHNARRKAMRLTYARCNRPAHSPLSSGISKGNAVSVKVETLILFGATGDLAHRMLFPSLYNLHMDGLLADGLTIIGSGRSDLDRAAFHAQVREALAEHLPEDRIDPPVVDMFLDRIDYCAVDAGKGAGYDDLAALLGDRMARPIGVYLSTPPSMFGPIAQGLAAANIACAECRIAMEKPIGHDLASSREVNAQVGDAFAEDRVFRIDHYLGKETVQNLLALRFANMLFEPLWNEIGRAHV